MKRILLSAALLAGFVGASAQSKDDEGGMSYGVKAGIAISNVTFSGSGVSLTYQAKVGLTGGAFVKIPLGGGGFSVQPEVNYSSMGARFTDFNDEVKLSLGYLQVPVMAQYEFANSGFHVSIGPQIGFLLSAKAKEDGDTEDVKEEFNKVDFSISTGLGYKIPNVPIRIDSRGYIGLSDVAKDNGMSGFKSRNIGGMITVAYVF